MRRALALADRALGHTAPNPAVGAVLVREGQLVGEGFTRPAGGPHAERVALADCAERGHSARGATMYVTLEPCCHYGRTPPCSAALLEAGVARVVVGVLDPYPPMQGRSVGELRAGGVEVSLGALEADCAERILGFARAITVGLPEVTCKAGITADGHIATASGESRWITGEASRADAHRLRDAHDAVLVGIGTVLADDPRLTVRGLPASGEGVPRKPTRAVVWDSDLRIPSTARLLAVAEGPGGGGPPVVVCAEDAPLRELSAELVRVPRAPGGGVDPEAALRALAERGLHRILVEGGGLVHRALLDGQLADWVVLYVAPRLLPGGRGFVGGPPLQALAEAIPMDLRDVARTGPDVRLTYRLAHGLAPDPLAALRTADPTR